MERKNTVLLTVIAVATLLVAVVGATFAYFTATSTQNRGESSVDVSTEKVGETKFSFTSETGGADLLDYPGGYALFGAKALGEKDSVKSPEDSNEYDFSFKLKIVATNATSTQLKWHLFATDEAKTLESTCQFVVDPQSATTTSGDPVGSTHKQETLYYYTEDGTKYDNKENINGSKDCTAENMEVSTTFGEEIASGTIKAGASEETVDGSISLQKISTKTNNGTKYYYVVVEYPNTSDQTENDVGKQIKVSIGIDGDIETTISEN